jgi:hypothetical protein
MRLKHTTDFPCPSCEAKKKTAHPLIAYWFDRIKAVMPDVHTSCMFRGEADQNEAVRTGMSKLRWPKSKHNYMLNGNKPYALAMDLFRLTQDGKAQFPLEFYEEISMHLKEWKAPIDWGKDLWNWDLPHFQLKDDKTVHGPKFDVGPKADTLKK